MTDPFTIHELNNGLRVIIESMPEVSSAAAGFLARTGARDETAEVAGVSHFLEHMCFKGTDKRDWRRISIDFDEMGSTYNAFTSEDRTFYYGWVPRDKIVAQIELLADMMRPTLPTEAFDTEKEVILEEIAMAKDSIEHLAIDFLLEHVFKGHPLAWPILGYDKTVQPLLRDQLHAYYAKRYTADKIMLVVAGNVDVAQIIDTAEKLCGEWSNGNGEPARTPPTVHTGSASKVVERFNQQLIAKVYPAPSATDPLNETAEAALSILGGANSRIYWNIVQKGISARATAYRYDMADCGLTILYGQTEPDRVEELSEAIDREAQAICSEPVSEAEVSRVRNKRRTTLAVEGESPYHRLTQMMDDVDYRGTPRTLSERLAAVEAVTVESVTELFDRYPIDRGGYLISVGPRDWPGAGASEP